MRLTREFYIPRGSSKVADKQSDAVAYVYERDGKPFAAIFYGKQAKPVSHYSYKNAEQRESDIRRHFECRRKSQDAAKARRVERSKPHTLEVGHILVSSWGYEQTNVNFYQITKLLGSHMVEVREVAQVSNDTAYAQGTCAPKLDEFRGEPMRRRASSTGSVRISSCQIAFVWDGRPRSWTAYH